MCNILGKNNVVNRFSKSLIRFRHVKKENMKLLKFDMNQEYLIQFKSFKIKIDTNQECLIRFIRSRKS